MTRQACGLSLTLLVLCGLAGVHGDSTTTASGQELLRATAPGAYSVRYLPDRALISSSAGEPTELRVYLPNAPKWGYVNGVAKPGSYFGWSQTDSIVILKLDAERHSIQVGWEGSGEQPKQGQKIPVLVAGEQVGELSATFTLDGVTAEGALELPYGLGRTWLTTNQYQTGLDATLAVGDAKVGKWRAVRGRFQGRGHIGLGGSTLVRLSMPGYNLLTPPVKDIEIEVLSPLTDVVRIPQMPQDGILVEAEDFTAEGGGTVQISEGAHLDQHGGKSIFSFTGDGHWLDWEFEVPQDGLYDVFAKIACGQDASVREIRVDGSVPAPGYRLVKFPGTGGWAHAPGEWWNMQIAGANEALPPLELSAGKHTLRLKGVFEYHLNVDYFVIVGRDGS